MKIGWGYRITFLYLGFVCIIAFLVIGSMKQDVELVADDYYEQEIRYQERIDQIKRDKSHVSEIKVNQEKKHLIISFPINLRGKRISGSAFLFRPSDSNLDQSFNLKVNSDGIQKFSTDNIKTGLYLLKIEYEIEGEGYYFEQKIIIA